MPKLSLPKSLVLHFLQMDKLVDGLYRESIKVYNHTGLVGDSSRALWALTTQVSS